MRVEQQRRRPRRGVAISDSEFDNDPCSCAGYDGYIDDDLGDLSRGCATTIRAEAARRSGDRNNGMHDEPEAASPPHCKGFRDCLVTGPPTLDPLSPARPRKVVETRLSR